MTEHLEVPPSAAGTRVDQFVSQQRPELTRSHVQRLIESHHLTIDSAVVKSSHRVRGGERISIVIPDPVPAEPQAEDLPLEVVHEDKHVLVVNKAAGVVVHPGAGHHGGTLVNAVLHHVDDLQGIHGTLRPGIVHRLDKDTSGLLVIAKSEKALTALQAQFKAREVHKTYLALVYGTPPPSGTIETLYGRHPRQRLKFTGKVKDGKRAVTHFKVTKQLGKAALIEVLLETGRTHQIRVHCAEAGFPLLGDELYGTKASQALKVIERQALHAWKLAFVHPVSRKKLSFEVEAPADFKKALKALATGSSTRAAP